MRWRNRISWAIVTASLLLVGLVCCDPVRKPKPFVPFGAAWYRNFGVKILFFLEDSGRLPHTDEGLQALTSYEKLIYNELEYIYELDSSGQRFRVHIPSSSPETTFGVRGELLGEGIVLLRGEFGPSQAYRPTSELLFLSTVDKTLLPALEHFFDDFGRYPCFHEWDNDVLLVKSSEVLCQTETCTMRRSRPHESRTAWSGPYIRGVDAMAVVRGPFQRPLYYKDCASGRGFQIWVRGPDGLRPAEGALSIIRLRRLPGEDGKGNGAAWHRSNHAA